MNSAIIPKLPAGSKSLCQSHRPPQLDLEICMSLPGNIIRGNTRSNTLYNAAVRFLPGRFRQIGESSNFILDPRSAAFVYPLLDIPDRVTE